MNSSELIKTEMDEVTEKVKESLSDARRLAIGEVWKVLQVATATVIQIIEKTGTDLESPTKKALAMSLINGFYDKVFLVVDIPLVPSFLEPIIHSHVKSFLMLLVSASIDALVTTFRQTGVFLQKNVIDNPYDPYVMKV